MVVDLGLPDESGLELTRHVRSTTQAGIDCKRVDNRIERRLDKKNLTFGFKPQLAACKIHYEVSDKIGAIRRVIR